MTGDRMTKAQRWMDLIAALLGRRTPMDVDEIFEAVPAYREKAGPEGDPDPASVRRMFERDKDELRELGIPIDTVPFRTNYGQDVVDGYRLRPGAFYLPYVRIVEEAASAGPRSPRSSAERPTFERDELDVALTALREVAGIPGWPLADSTRSAYRKLAFDMDSVPAEGGVRHLAPPGAAGLAGSVRELAEAAWRRKRVQFRYHGMARGETTDRDVEPHGVFFERGAWYLVGHDALRDARRVFHVGRMEELRVNRSAPATPDYEMPEDASIGEYTGREAWDLVGAGEPVAVRVRFEHPLSLWAERNGHGRLEAELDDGASVRRFEVSSAEPFIRWLLGLGGEARLLEPPELVEALHATAARIAEIHG